MRITQQSQVTIPQDIRNRLGLLPHTKSRSSNWPAITRAFARLADRHFSIDDRITPLVLNRAKLFHQVERDLVEPCLGMRGVYSLAFLAKWHIINSQEARMETEAIAEILGGRKVLGKTIKKPDDLSQLVREGLPAGSVTALAKKLHLGNSVLSRKLGIPQRTGLAPIFDTSS